LLKIVVVNFLLSSQSALLYVVVMCSYCSY